MMTCVHAWHNNACIINWYLLYDCNRTPKPLTSIFKCLLLIDSPLTVSLRSLTSKAIKWRETYNDKPWTLIYMFQIIAPFFLLNQTRLAFKSLIKKTNIRIVLLNHLRNVSLIMDLCSTVRNLIEYKDKVNDNDNLKLREWN